MVKRIKFKPHDYQEIALDFIDQHDKALLILDMGLGKTVVTLTALRKGINSGKYKKPLIIAPKIVSENTWASEIGKWVHLRNLRYTEIDATNTEKRLAQFDRIADGTVTILSESKLQWLVDMLNGEQVRGISDTDYEPREWPFDCIVIDEISIFKNPQSNRFKNLKKKVQISCDYVIGLTGTPAPNSLADLWAIMYFIDNGARLGKTKKMFNKAYCSTKKIKINSGNNQQYIKTYTVNPEAYAEILDDISDVALAMRAADWLTDHQEPNVQLRPVFLSSKASEAINVFKRERVLNMLKEAQGLELDKSAERLKRRISRLEARGTIKAQRKAAELKTRLERNGAADGAIKITATHVFSVINANRQLAGGAIFEQIDTTGMDEEEIASKLKEDRKVIKFHDDKLKMLDEIIEDAADNVFIFVSYRHEAERIAKRYKGVEFLNTANAQNVLPRWNAGEIPILVANPASTKFGLNMQQGGHTIVWYSLGYSFEAYTQSNARLARQGQKELVNVHILQSFLADGTPTIDAEISEKVEMKRLTNSGIYSYLNGDGLGDLDIVGQIVQDTKNDIAQIAQEIGERVEFE